MCYNYKIKSFVSHEIFRGEEQNKMKECKMKNTKHFSQKYNN